MLFRLRGGSRSGTNAVHIGAGAIPGMLLHMDGSQHRWFQDERQLDRIVILDDATSDIDDAQLVDPESTRTVMAAIQHVVETKGWFSCLYSDRTSHFFRTPKAGGPIDARERTKWDEP